MSGNECVKWKGLTGMVIPMCDCECVWLWVCVTHGRRCSNAAQDVAVGRQHLASDHQLRAAEEFVEAVLGDV